MTGRTSPVRARWSVSTIFFVNGAVLASWVPHIPAVKAAHALGDGALGLVLLSMAAGSVLALTLAGWLVGRIGSRATTSMAAIALCLTLPLPILSPAIPLLALSLVLVGASNATLDVAMNAQAVLVEREYGRPIMSSFHGLFSLGGLAGAALAGLAIGLGVPPAYHVVVSAVVALLAVGRALRWLVPSDAADASASPVFARPSGVLFGLGVLAFFGLLAEGAMADWSAVYLRDTLETTPAVAVAGFAAFSLAMAAGRFRGDRLVSLLGPGRLLGASGAVAACGLGGALLVGAPAAAVIGCGLVGLGISNVIPVLFSAAGHVRGIQAGTALAAVATIGYLGLLAGPPLIGLTAHVTSLPVALGLVSAFCAAIGVGGRALVPAVIPARSAPS